MGRVPRKSVNDFLDLPQNDLQTDPMSHLAKITPDFGDVVQAEEHMKNRQWKINIVSRTIGADRGRAARGRPVFE